MVDIILKLLLFKVNNNSESFLIFYIVYRRCKLIYENIKVICKKLGISINKLEIETGMSRGSVSKWNTHTPTVSNLKIVADYLNTSLDELIK